MNLTYNTEIINNSFTDIKNSIICACCQIILINKIKKDDWSSVINVVSPNFKATRYPIVITNLEDEFKKTNDIKKNPNTFKESFIKIKDKISYKKIFCGVIDWLMYVNQFCKKMNIYKDKARQMRAILTVSSANVYDCLLDNENKETITDKTIAKTIGFAMENFNNNIADNTKRIKFK